MIDAGTRQGRNFAPERTQPGANVFEAVKAHVDGLQSAGKRVVFALWSDGARDRMSHVLADHELLNLTPRRRLAGDARPCRSRRSGLPCSGSSRASRPRASP